MVEAGVRLVHVNWVRHDNGKGGQGYDTHRNHLELARRDLLPATDAAFASLVEDLHLRGLLDETLVIMMGEFGRTPRFNKDGGRDHWPGCFSVVMAGGGIRGGQVLGASDRLAAYPAADPVTPEDIIATLYHALGVDPHLTIFDRQDRPFRLVDGEPLLKNHVRPISHGCLLKRHRSSEGRRGRYGGYNDFDGPNTQAVKRSAKRANPRFHPPPTHLCTHLSSGTKSRCRGPGSWGK